MIDEEFIDKNVVGFYLCYNTNSDAVTNTSELDWRSKISEWASLSEQDKKSWENKFKLWLEEYYSKYPDQLNVVFNNYKSIEWN